MTRFEIIKFLFPNGVESFIEVFDIVYDLWRKITSNYSNKSNNKKELINSSTNKKEETKPKKLPPKKIIKKRNWIGSSNGKKMRMKSVSIIINH